MLFKEGNITLVIYHANFMWFMIKIFKILCVVYIHKLLLLGVIENLKFNRKNKV